MNGARLGKKSLNAYVNKMKEYFFGFFVPLIEKFINIYIKRHENDCDGK